MSKKCKNCERCTQSLGKVLAQNLTGIGAVIATADALAIAERKCPDCGHMLKLHTDEFHYHKPEKGKKR